jgi:hypothetical protein
MEETEITIEDFFAVCEKDGGKYEIEGPDGWHEINLLMRKKDNKCVVMRLSDSSELECSEFHLIFTPTGWKMAIDLDVDNDVVDTINGFKKIVSIQTSKVQNTFDLNIESETNSYFANGIVSHNSGKSLAAKAAAALFQIPLLRMDFGALFGQYMGESERQARQAISIAEKVSPCVLWCDEIDKGLSGHASGGKLDSGVTARVISTFLTWMQEKQSMVFFMCTANEQANIPTEFLRAGRFDEIFFVDLPTRIERMQIITKLIQRKGRDPQNFDLAKISAVSNGYTGAEIEKAIDMALRRGFADGRRPIETDDITLSLDRFKPLSKVRPEAIEAMQLWAAERCIKANTPDPVPGSIVGNKNSTCKKTFNQ